MRFVRQASLIIVAIVLFVVALANREPTTLHLLPAEFGMLTGRTFSLEVPLFLVGFGGIVVGLLLGFVWEWLREGKYRAAAARDRREKDRLSREMDRMKGAGGEDPDDEIRMLLENGR